MTEKRPLDEDGCYKDARGEHRYLAPKEICKFCRGRGCYPTESHPYDKYCDCPAGTLRYEFDMEIRS